MFLFNLVFLVIYTFLAFHGFLNLGNKFYFYPPLFLEVVFFDI